ncbi:MAG: DUF2948 family protein [Alphaproteobacteria bacterium]|nr:DUF2948 family protein [Alphaproteobacteria bacterium]NCQ66641.1 DUF2948 family protein [Alphaproteobacteria bacterium]NCT06993.1 DUF2948 family protein [Alphaproteobacteria bacterium]
MAIRLKTTGAQKKIQGERLSQRQELIQARQLSAVPHELLKLKASDFIDLKVISALVQDALVPVSNFHYDQAGKAFTILANRFCWEESPEILNHQKVYGRILCGLYFKNVDKVQQIAFDRKKTDQDYNLLAIEADKEDEIRLIFSGDSRIKLTVSRLCCHLTDLEDMRYTITKPDHERKSA